MIALDALTKCVHAITVPLSPRWSWYSVFHSPAAFEDSPLNDFLTHSPFPAFVRMSEMSSSESTRTIFIDPAMGHAFAPAAFGLVL